MLDIAVTGYTAEAVREVLHGKAGTREVTFRYDLLGADNVYKHPLRVIAGEVSMNATAAVQRTGRFSFRDDAGIDWQNDRIKPWFQLRMPDGGRAEWPLGVFYMPTAPRKMMGNVYYREVEAYDLSMALTQDAVTRRYLVRRHTPYLSAVATVLSSAGIRRFIARDDTGEVLSTDREWEMGTSKQQIIADLLAAINYNSLSVSPDGVFTATRYVPPDQRDVSYVYRADELSVVRDGGTSELDTFGIPNVFVGVVSSPDVRDMSYTYVVDNPANPVSAYNRSGRRVVKLIRFDDIASAAVLQAAVHRAAYEAMQIYERTSFTTTLMPHHEAGELLMLEHSAADGRYEETSWRMSLEAGADMQHEARKLVYL